MSVSLVLFETAVGTCGIAWSTEGIRQLQLPEADRQATLARLQRRAGEAEQRGPDGASEAWVWETIDRVARHLAGSPQDLGALRVDLAGTPAFHRQVYLAALAIPSGQTVTYAELATRVGSPGAARAVGQAMAQNPVPVIVPCHRVLAAGHAPGGFSAYGGLVTKARLLALEGVILPGAETLPLPGMDP